MINDDSHEFCRIFKDLWIRIICLMDSVNAGFSLAIEGRKINDQAPVSVIFIGFIAGRGIYVLPVPFL